MLRRDSATKVETGGHGLKLAALALVVVFGFAGCLAVAGSMPVPLDLGLVALVGPNCRDTAVFTVTSISRGGPGFAGTDRVTSHQTYIPEGASLTYGGSGGGGVVATRTGGIPVKAVVGRHVLELFRVAVVLR